MVSLKIGYLHTVEPYKHWELSVFNIKITKKKLNCVPHCISKLAQKSILHYDFTSARKVFITSD